MLLEFFTDIKLKRRKYFLIVRICASGNELVNAKLLSFKNFFSLLLKFKVSRDTFRKK